MWLLWLANLNMGAGGTVTPTISVYPDPFAATASATINPFAATSVSTVNPFAATSRQKGS